MSTGLPSTTFTDSHRIATEENVVKTARRKSQCLGSKSGAGFTLLELMISIALIGILFSIAIMVLSGARAKSRDSERMQHMRQIQNALNLYYADSGNFPIEASKVTITGTDTFSIEIIASGAIRVVQKDPTHPSNSYTYQSDGSGSTFTLSFCLETASIQAYSQGCGNTITP